jgi:glucose-1-phosphate thymidylyltransferase
VKGLLLAGGHGTRLRPLTSTGNKHMIPVANQPILFYGLQQLARVGIKEVGIVLGPIREGIRETVGSGDDFGLRVTYIEQGPPRGLADAVRCAREFLGEDDFVMYLGDNILESGLSAFVDSFVHDQADAVVGVTPVADAHRYGIVELEGNRIVSIEEKPRKPKSNLALVGVYVFSPRIHSIIDTLPLSGRGELEITDALQRLVQGNGRVAVQRVYGWWKDTGAPEDLLEANDLVLNSMPTEAYARMGTVSKEATVSGNVAIGRDSVVEAGAVIEGPAVIGSGVKIGRGTWVGPGMAVGNQVELTGCSIRRSIVLEGARILGSVSIHDSLIGRNAEILGYGLRHREVSFIIGDASRIRL